MADNELVTTSEGLTADKVLARMGEWRSEFSIPVVAGEYQTKIHEYTSDEEKMKYMQLALKAPVPMSEYQIANFVIAPQLTASRQVRQCILELQSRGKALETTKLDYRRENIKLQKLEREWENSIKDNEDLDTLDIELYEMDLKEQKINIRRIENSIVHTEHEMNVMLKMMKEADEAGIDVQSISEGSYMDPEEEKDYWIQRMSKQAGLDLLTTGTIGMGNLDAIITMDPEDQKEVFKHALGFHNELKGQLEGAERNLLEDQGSSSEQLNWTPPQQLESEPEQNVSPPPEELPEGVMNKNLLD